MSSDGKLDVFAVFFDNSLLLTIACFVRPLFIHAYNFLFTKKLCGKEETVFKRSGRPFDRRG